MNILDFYRKKSIGEKITMVTCYDYTSACIIAETQIDCVLVGDSIAMTLYGYPTTISATLTMIRDHTAAVARGLKKQFLVSDLPFLSYRRSLSKSVKAAEILMRAGAHAVKLEGAAGNIEFIQHLTESGVPVMGHLGLTPQFLNLLGGYKVQGKTADSAARLIADAHALQKAGCFALVLECVPRVVASEITQQLAIPCIGIGAGASVDGQVLVFQDVLGLNTNFKPTFLKVFAEGKKCFQEGIQAYINEVKAGVFPADEHCY